MNHQVDHGSQSTLGFLGVEWRIKGVELYPSLLHGAMQLMVLYPLRELIHSMRDLCR